MPDRINQAPIVVFTPLQMIGYLVGKLKAKIEEGCCRERKRELLEIARKIEFESDNLGRWTLDVVRMAYYGASSDPKKAD